MCVRLVSGLGLVEFFLWGGGGGGRGDLQLVYDWYRHASVMRLFE